MNQKEFVRQVIDETVPDYNNRLFTRSTDEIIDALENTILSCQRYGVHAVVRVKKFTVIENYSEIRKRLRDYQDFLLAKPSSKGKGPKDNRYQYIDMKSSDIKLLVVTYFISTQDKDGVTQSDTLDVLIAVPRVVNKFYFRLNGMIYSSTYQIVDASTYNTSSSKSSNKHFVTLKTQFQHIRVYRNFNNLRTTSGEDVKCCTYANNTFKKSVLVSLYMFAKMGFYATLNFLGISSSVFLSKEDPCDKNVYTFKAKKQSEVFVNCPRELFDNIPLVQHVVHTILEVSKTCMPMEVMFTDTFWVMALGAAFNNQTDPEAKGRNILSSLELIYDIGTKQEIHLPEECKHDTYCILRWMLWEYNNLRIKDNLNILTKKINVSKYISGIYAAKLSRKIYTLSDTGKDADLSKIRKAIITNPMYLISEMTKDKLINFRNITTDMDSFLACKFTYKGETGISSISKAYKLCHPSNLGVLDLDSSSPSDPGTSGTIVPMVQLYDGNYFSEFQEPTTFEGNYATILENYRKSRGLIEVIDMKAKLLGDKQDYAKKINEAEESVQATYRLLKSGQEIDIEYSGLPLEGSGTIQYV